MMLRDWFQFMLSIPRRKPMTKTEKFFQWSSLVAYCLGGFSFLAAPELYRIILNLEYHGRSEGYIRLAGLGVVDIGFIFIIVARSNHKADRHGTIFASFLSRVIWIPATGLMLILRDMVPVAFAALFMGLDASFTLGTLIIWCWETDEPSFSAFFTELLTPFRECRGVKTRGSITVMFIIGLIQGIFWYILVVKPDFALKMLALKEFQGYASGYLAVSFYLISIHGLYHVLCANNANLCLAPVSFCYRIFLNFPVLLILFLVDQIERNLFLAVLTFDLIVSFILLCFMIREGRPSENTAVSPSRSPEVESTTF